MPFLNAKPQPYKPTRDLEVKWDNFRGGLNLFFKPTELKPSELAQADNLMLTGAGVPTGRWGSEVYNLAGSGKIRMMAGYYDSLASINRLVTISDLGLATYKSNASYIGVIGASFVSGTDSTSALLGRNLYISSGPSTPFVRFSGASLIPYVSLSAPTGVTATNLSGASGFTTWSWRISSKSQAGETIASTSYALASLPLDLSTTRVKVSWTGISAASGILKGYEVYRGFPGDETWVGSVDSVTTSFIDVGESQSDTIFPPQSDRSAGPKARYIIKFNDRLVMAGFDDDPTLVMISARYPYQDRFNWSDGGGYIRVDPDGGDDITGLGISGNQGSDSTSASIIVTKNSSVHRVVLGSTTIGNYQVLDPQVQFLASNGCAAHGTIAAVENDSFYFGRKGLYVIGQEPNFLNQIRTNEISARIRPYISNLSPDDFKMATAAYIDNKYILSFPTKKETIIYDRERAAFMGPWITDFAITKWIRYIDENGTERYLAGCDDGYIREFSSAYIDDSGDIVSKTLRTKKEDFGSWGSFKLIKLFKVLFRNVRGTVNVSLRLETKDGNTVTSKSFNITSSQSDSGYGVDSYGDVLYGTTEAEINLSGDELVRWTRLFKQARVAQIEVTTTSVNTNFEFLSSLISSQDFGPESLTSDTRV